MKTTAYQQQYANRFFRTVLICVIVFLGVYSGIAQQRMAFSNIKYKGFEASFGTRSFQVNSNIKKINLMQAGHEGGNLGIFFGNDVFLTRVKLGYFYSDANTPQTQEIFESAISVNTYPLGLLKKAMRIRPYLTTGIGLDNVKFYGTYLDNGTLNQSAYEPMIGKVAQLGFMGGAGIAYSLSKYNDFISLFAEANTVIPINVNSSNQSFNQTTLSQNMAVNVGIRFGLNSKNLYR